MGRVMKNQVMAPKGCEGCFFCPVGPANARGQRGTIGGFKNLKDWKEFGMRLGLEFVVQHAVFPHEAGGGLNRLRALGFWPEHALSVSRLAP